MGHAGQSRYCGRYGEGQAVTSAKLLMMNTFTDTEPTFPYESSEARRQLGLPDSSEIHLAVTELAVQLLQIAETADTDPAVRRIAALRTASGAVLFGWPLPTAELELRTSLGMPPNSAAPARYRIHEGMDWLGLAVNRLREEGVHIAPGYQRQRSDFGWVER